MAGSMALPALSRSNRSRVFDSADVVGKVRLLPFWVPISMILLASLGVCSTIIVRSHEQFEASSFQYSRMVSEVDLLRRHNASLQVEITRLSTDAHMIESEARSRLGMVRPNDVVVVDERVKLDSNSREISFVH